MRQYVACFGQELHKLLIVGAALEPEAVIPPEVVGDPTPQFSLPQFSFQPSPQFSFQPLVLTDAFPAPYV